MPESLAYIFLGTALLLFLAAILFCTMSVLLLYCVKELRVFLGQVHDLIKIYFPRGLETYAQGTQGSKVEVPKLWDEEKDPYA